MLSFELDGTLVTALVVGVFWIFFDLRLAGSAGLLTGVLALGVLGFVALGTLFSAVSVRSTMGETLLPILIFPLLVPVVIYGVSATARIFAGRPPEEIAGNLKMLGAFALVSLAVGAGLFRFVVEE
jgi:heme exporter protein B